MGNSALNISGRNLFTLNPSGRNLYTLNLTGRTLGDLNISGRTLVGDPLLADVVSISPATVTVAGQTVSVVSKDAIQLSPAVATVTGQTVSIVEGTVPVTNEAGWNFENTLASSTGKAVTFSNPGSLGYGTGISGMAIDINGTNKLESADPLFINVGDEDIEMLLWIKLKAISQNHGVAGQSVNEYSLHILTNGTVRWRLKGSSILNSASGAINDTTTWHHLNARYNATTDIMTLVVDNGTPLTLGSVTALTPSAANFTIGSIASGNIANALIDSFKFKRGLFSSLERSNHWNGGAGGPV